MQQHDARTCVVVKVNHSTDDVSWCYEAPPQTDECEWKHLGQPGGNEEGADNALFEKTLQRTGAYVMGKRMFDEGETNWPEDLYKAPVYVVTHEKREPWVQRGSTVFYFVNDGARASHPIGVSACASAGAAEAAKAAAGMADWPRS